MSFVTTPTSSSPASAAHSAATSVLFPVPTGPAIPIRSARSRSAGKEPPRVVGVALGAQVEQRCGGGGQLARGGRLGGERLDQRARGGDPPRRVDGVEREQLRRGRGHRRGVLVEREAGDLDGLEARGGA